MYHHSFLSWAYHLSLHQCCFLPFLHHLFQALDVAYVLRKERWGYMVPRALVSQQNSDIGVQHRPWSDNVHLSQSWKRRMKCLVLYISKEKWDKMKIILSCQIKNMVLFLTITYELTHSPHKYIQSKTKSLCLQYLISWKPGTVKVILSNVRNNKRLIIDC